MEENTTIDDFYSIGLGFTNKSDTPETNVTENKDLNNDDSFIDSIDKNNSLADQTINEAKEKNEIVVETISKDSDSVVESESVSAESYKINMGFKHKDFSLEDAFYSVLTTENINKASDTELKAVGNMLILLKKHIGLINRRYFEGFTDIYSNTILKNLIASNNSIGVHNTYLSYKTNSIETIFDNLLDFLNNFTNNGNVGDIISSLQLLGDEILNIFDKLVPGIKVNIIAGSKTCDEQLTKLNELLLSPINTPDIITKELFGVYRVQKDAPISTVVDSIELINNISGSFRKIVDLSLSDKYSTSINNIKECVSKNDISLDINDKMIVEKVTEMIYRFTNIIVHFLHHVIEDCKCFCETLGKDTTEETSKEDLEIKKDGTSDPFVISDYHLIDDLLIGDNQMTRSNKLIENHNKYITNEDDVIFLGDLSGSETFTKGNETLPDKLKSLVKKLNHRNMILIIGNNDYISQTEFYKECGFDEVYPDPVLIQNPNISLPNGIEQILLSHEPVDLKDSKNILNIHGHIHGTKKYYNMDSENHIDVFYSLYPKPMRLSELIEFFKDGKYNNAKTVKV